MDNEADRKDLLNYFIHSEYLIVVPSRVLCLNPFWPCHMVCVLSTVILMQFNFGSFLKSFSRCTTVIQWLRVYRVVIKWSTLGSVHFKANETNETNGKKRTQKIRKYSIPVYFDNWMMHIIWTTPCALICCPFFFSWVSLCAFNIHIWSDCIA